MKWAAILAGLVGLYVMPKATDPSADQPRGIRNNNPGNIRYDGVTPWRGMVSVDGGGFVVFDTPENGIRAMARVLTNYERVHGLNTVAGIIGRWAPATENDTRAYVADVAARLGVPEFMSIDVQARLGELIAAIIAHENGQQPYSMAQIQSGVALA